MRTYLRCFDVRVLRCGPRCCEDCIDVGVGVRYCATRMQQGVGERGRRGAGGMVVMGSNMGDGFYGNKCCTSGGPRIHRHHMI